MLDHVRRLGDAASATALLLASWMNAMLSGRWS
jgi:hypothetical protein